MRSRLVSLRSALSSASCLLTVATVSAFTPASAWGQIEFTAKVPPVPQQVQIYRLAITPAPVEFLNEKLKAARLPELRMENKRMVTRGATGTTDQDRMRAFSDPETGDVHFIPNLRDLATSTGMRAQIGPEAALGVARRAFADVRFIPKDATTLRVSETIPVMGSSIEHGAASGPEARQVMAMVPAMRYANGWPVYGRGSRALISVANDESITGLLRRWRTASPGEKVKAAVNAEGVKESIIRQLRPYARNARATVDKIELAYYDGNAKYMQPVYRFEAELVPLKSQAGEIRIAGYVPIGTPLEPIPNLAAPPEGPRPSMTRTPLVPAQVPQAKAMMTGGPRVITVGEFANQDWPTSNAYLEMANSFLSGLNFGHLFAFGQPSFSRTLWWTAYPWQVNSPQSVQWMNAVNVAYTEPHGDWLLNTTKSDDAQLWYVDKIGTGGNAGFGAAAGGVLATWVIMSCEVIPSFYDRANEAGGSGSGSAAFTPWWPVFQGLHNAIGFRTIMFYPDDALNFGFGLDAALGGDINAAWFDEVAAYDGNDGTYKSGHLKGGPMVHYDRASTMVDGRDLGQSIYAVGAQTASGTLWNFWMGN